MASNKKKQDEKYLKMLREMVALPNNKQCVDCYQRGPTYVNMTIGSFVCTACSGLLRGLNPPHRVKSISMASFTADEIEFITCHGNEYCRKVWLGLYDERLNNQAESRDESKVKDFMIQKYEKKRYYVAPSESMKEEAKQMNEVIINKAPTTKPLKSLLSENAPKLQVGNTQEKSESALSVSEEPFITVNPFEEISVEVISVSVEPNITVNHFGEDIASSPVKEEKTQSSTPPQLPGNQGIQSSKPSGSTAMGDLLGGLGDDPFTTSAPQAHAATAGGFADFGNFGSTGSSQPQSTPSQLGGPSQQSFNGPSNVAVTKASGPPAGTGNDKYSNLSDLFSLDNAASDTSSSSGWSTTLNTNKNIGWSSTASSSGGVNWGGDSTTSAGTGGLNWNGGSSTQPASASSGGLNWGGSSAASSTTSWGTAPATQSTNMANPFGSSSNAPLANQPAMGGMVGASKVLTANPFGTQPGVVAGGFGAYGTPGTAAPLAPAYGGQFGAPASSTGAGYGQFGGTPASSAGSGFGQFPAQNGGFSGNVSSGGFGGAQTNTAAGFGAQSRLGGAPAAFGQPQQQLGGFGGVPGAATFGNQPAQGLGQMGQPVGYGGQMPGFGVPAQSWGQVPANAAAANPFMSAAKQYSAPKTGASNPFL